MINIRKFRTENDFFFEILSLIFPYYYLVVHNKIELRNHDIRRRFDRYYHIEIHFDPSLHSDWSTFQYILFAELEHQLGFGTAGYPQRNADNLHKNDRFFHSHKLHLDYPY